MSINYVKQSKSHYNTVCGSSKLLPSVSLSKEKGWLVSCYHHSHGLRCFYWEQDNSPCPKQLLVPAAIIISNLMCLACHPVFLSSIFLWTIIKNPYTAVLCHSLGVWFGRPCSHPVPPSSHGGKSSGQSSAGLGWGPELLKCWEGKRIWDY